MKNTLTQRLVLGMLAVFFLIYAGFQVWRYFADQYKTETVYTYTVADSARVNGVLLRDEVLLDDRIGDGVAVYLATDGTKVSTGFPIAEVYHSEEDAKLTARVRDLEKQQAQLKKAQDPGTTAYAHTDVLNKQIFGELEGIISDVDADSMSGLSDRADRLLVLMNTKQIATGKQKDFNSVIERLNAEVSYYEGKIKSEPAEINSPRPGYFMRSIDGFEGKVDLTKLDELDAGTLVELQSTPVQSDNGGRVGKLMTSQKWYYAVVVPGDEALRYKEGAEVQLDFNLSGVEPVPATVWQINTPKQDRNAPEDADLPDVVVIFRSDYVNEQLVNLRVAQAEVRFKSVSGLRVSSAAIRFQGIQKGVYIIRGETLVFRPVTVIYEDNGFVLCQEVPATDVENYPTSLQQYDEVVIEGAQLYDRKPIK